MSWLKGLAGKAEDLLNQIDQNAAVAFQSDTKDDSSQDLTEVKWDEQPPRREVSAPTISMWSRENPSMQSARSAPNLAAHSSPMTASSRHNDDELISYLNSPEPAERPSASIEPAREAKSDSTVSESQSHSESPALRVLFENRNLNVYSESSSSLPRSESSYTDSGLFSLPQSTPSVTSRSESSSRNTRAAEDLRTENVFLRNELRSLNNEMSLLLQRTKAAERECSELQSRLNDLQERAQLVNTLEVELQASARSAEASQDLVSSLQEENERLLQATSEASGSQNEAIQDLQRDLDAAHFLHRQEMSSLQEQFSIVEAERTNLNVQIAELQQQLVHTHGDLSDVQQQCERLRSETKEARDELEQYRTRAQRILQDKERFIAELRGEGSASRTGQLDDAVALELEQVHQESELLREETVQVSARLQAARDELHESEKKLETCREQAAEMQKRLQDSLQEERKKKQAAEEDSRTHVEELRSVREELSRQRSILINRVRERDAELTRLRGQLSQRPNSPSDDELESRLHTLTQTLVQKQSTLETVTTERNALRLQLEKMENTQRGMVASGHQNQSGAMSVNDTDDAKAQIPSFFVETPFDTGMTRRVKRAYSSLDAVSIRTGVFLRRYPLARILVLCYMILLHLWVLLVLFAYTPQAQ